MATRFDYSEADKLDRIFRIAATKCKEYPEISLWIGVLIRAIGDIVIASQTREKGKKLSIDQAYLEQTAIAFIFDDQYQIPFDYYDITITCQRCYGIERVAVADVAGDTITCPHCKRKTRWRYVKYDIPDDQPIKEITLEELLSLFGWNNIKQIREYLLKIVKPKTKEIIRRKYGYSPNLGED